MSNEENTPPIVRKHDKKKFNYNPEVKFKSKAHLQSYLVDKATKNKNKKFNMIIILT